MSTNRPPDDLLARVLSREASAAEAAAVARWVAANPEAEAEMARLRAAWGEGVPSASEQWDVDRAWAKARARRDGILPISSGSDRLAAAPRYRALTPWLRIAAVVALIAGGVWGWRALIPGGGSAAVYATVEGERRTVALSDGSTVVIAPRSTLTVPASYGRGQREVMLDGEAWFTVAHDESRPFAVLADGYRVRDIGTVFTVQARSADTVGVTVVEGSVAVARANADNEAETALVAGDVARFTSGAVPVLVRRGEPTAALASWATATDDAAASLDLVDVRVADVLAALERWFGVAVVVTPATLGQETVTITLPLNSLDRALDDIARLLGVTVHRGANRFELR